MSARPLLSTLSFGAALAVCALGARPALALQPLQSFLDSAKTQNPDALEASANARQQDALADVQLGLALPGVQLRGTYTHNQYDAEFPFTTPAMDGMPATTTTIVIQPYNQFDLYATLNVPLVNLAQFKRISAARRTTDASRRQLEATQLQVSGAVAQAYYQLVANLALVQASQRQLDVANQSLALSEDRYKLGAAPQLEVDRAKSLSETQVQQLASANLQLAIAQRQLQSASGLTPIIDASTDFTGDLHQEPGLEEFVKLVETVPSLQAAKLSTAAAVDTAEAQKLALVPALSGTFTEHLSNAPGFVGSDAAYQLVLALTWSFDLTSIASIKAQDAALDAARARELRARLAAGDAISNDWNGVRSAIARSQSARVGVTASKHAADDALDRYKAGAATQLDLLQAERDAFTAEVARIQADADLANARAQLRISVGQSLDEMNKNATTNAPVAPQGVQPK